MTSPRDSEDATDPNGALAPERQEVVTVDGRALRVFLAGADQGPLVLIHHGTPMSGCLYRRWHEDGRAQGVRIASYDRPGYGGSTRHPGRSVADAAVDAAAIADALGARTFVTWGISGGGPHALACAALLPERVAAAASLSGVAPRDAAGLDWLAGMGEDNVVEFSRAAQGEVVLRPHLEELAAGLGEATGASLQEEMSSLLPPADRQLLTTELAEYMQAAMGAGLQPGVNGWLDDDLAFLKPWGFELSDIRVPLLVFQGGTDLMVPAAHGQWLAATLEPAESRLDPQAGHLASMQDVGPFTSWLLAAGRGRLEE